jgi:hypothetical protein
MTQSAGQKGYKISTSAAMRTHKRYSLDARDREDEPQQMDIADAGADSQQSSQNGDRNSGSEQDSRRNK